MHWPITLPSSTLNTANRWWCRDARSHVSWLAAPRLDRQTWLRAVECLDLTLLIEREHDGVGRGIDIKADDVGELGGKTRIARMFDGADPMRLQLIGLPDALHRAQRNAGCLGHRTAGPMSGLMRRRGAGQRHHSRRGLRCDRGLSRACGSCGATG